MNRRPPPVQEIESPHTSALPSMESLRCFAAAASLLNFRRGARQVGLTPAAFGSRISQLEVLLGHPLFFRTTRRVELTSEGSRVLPRVLRLLEDAQMCVVDVRDKATHPPVSLTVGTRHELGMSWLLPLLESLEKSMPWLRANLFFGSGSDLIEHVRASRVDCAVTSSRLADPRVSYIQLHREDYVFCAAPALLQNKPIRNREDTERHTLIDASEDLPLFSYWQHAAGPGVTLRFCHVSVMGTLDAIHQRVRNGHGVAVLPKYFVQKDLDKRRLLPILKGVVPQFDYFRLLFRTGDPRRGTFETLAQAMMEFPLR